MKTFLKNMKFRAYFAKLNFRMLKLLKILKNFEDVKEFLNKFVQNFIQILK